MKKIKSLIEYFSLGERILWLCSIGIILASFFIFKSNAYMNLVASLIGATSLIFCAKGNPFGQVLIIAFSILYGIISYSYAYYGEMLTYLGMTLPMAIVGLISWLRNPYKGNKAQVTVKRLKGMEFLIATLLTAVVTFLFYFILEYFNTANLIPSTVSIATSFFAVYLTARRSPYFALAYALNDIVLIWLWTLASFTDLSYVSVTVCFVAFLANDIYSFINWKKMEKAQSNE